MSEGFQVMRLGAGDVARMRELNLVFSRAFEDPEHYESAPPTDADLRERLANPHHLVLAAVDAGAVVGGLTAYELQKFEAATSEIYIYDLAVEAGYRRRGVATALINALRAVAPSRRAKVVFVQADYGDDPAIALYESLGTREAVLHFDIEVEGD